MLSQVVVETAETRTFNIEAVSPDEILIIQKISGLTSPGNTQYSGETAQGRGYYQGRRPNKLTPVITFELNPNYQEEISVRAIRDILYRTFYQPQEGSDGVYVKLIDDEGVLPELFFVGYCEDINTDQFSQEQNAQVSMIALDSYLFAVDATTETSGPGWITKPFTYDGSADTGLLVTIEVRVITTEVHFALNGVPMRLTGNFAIGDDIVINTIQGQRQITVNGVDKMASLQGSTWLALYGGREDNTISAYGSVPGDGDAVITSYWYRSAFWGL